MRWVLFPPVISIFLLIPTALFHNREQAVDIPAVIWGATIAAYLCFCCLSAFFISRNDREHNIGVALLSQGMLLMVVSLRAGSPLLAWLGLVSFVIGLTLSFYYTTNERDVGDSTDSNRVEADNNEIRERIDSLVEKLALPMCITDAKGMVIGVTSKFCEATGKSEEDLTGEVVSEILPLDQDTVVFDSGMWWISQIKEGARYYFSLLPTEDCKPASEQHIASAPEGVSIYDPETGLCVEEYRLIRGPQEISRSQRYKRSVSGILIELMFNPGKDVNLSEQQKHMMFVAFGTRIRHALRIPDCGFLLPDNRIQLILPETPIGGAKTLLSRLLTLPQDIFDDAIREAVHPKVKAGVFFYNGTTKMEYGIFSAALEEDFLKSKDGIPTSEAA